MNILVIGSATGREYFISKKIKGSRQVKELYVFLWSEHLPIRAIATHYKVGDIIKLEEIKYFISDKKIDYAIVCQGEAIAGGVVDYLNSCGINCVSPSKIFAKFEENKHAALKLISEIDNNLLPNSLYIDKLDVENIQEFLNKLPNNKVVLNKLVE